MGNSSSAKTSVFRFKQFEVDQSDCAMKINTDGVLLGAMAALSENGDVSSSVRILDIGTGTGVIALMLAQRFPEASVDAVEIDGLAAARAEANFEKSPFSSRLKLYPVALEAFAPENGGYDLIVSNPPFFLNALKNPDQRKQLARHTEWSFFDQLLHRASQWLVASGRLALVLPPDLADIVEKEAADRYGLFAIRRTKVVSFETAGNGKPVRIILVLGKQPALGIPTFPPKFVIYSKQKEYSSAYRHLLKDFFLSF